MSLAAAYSPPLEPRCLAVSARAHTAILACLVTGSLLLYAATTIRNGHTFRSSDGYLYYTHARSWYFDGDCDYENDMRLAPGFTAHECFFQRSPGGGGRIRNVMPCAWSVIALPFVAIADLMTMMHNAVLGTGIARDGYTGYYLAVVPLAHVLLGIAGLLITYALVARYFSKTVAALATAFVWCGTNVIYFVSVEPTMAHAASMAFVTGTIWTADTIHRSGWSWRRALALGLCCGMMGAVRHQNVAWMAVPIVLLAPPMASGVLRRRPDSCRDAGFAVVGALVAVLCFVPQFIATWVTEGTPVGHIAHWAPCWFEPDIARELFHRSTGLLTSYPLAGVALIGVFAYFYRTRWQVFPLALAAGLAVIFYINSCWWALPSARRYVCCMAVFALGLAVVLEWAARSRVRTIGVAIVLGGLCAQNVAMLLNPETSVS